MRTMPPVLFSFSALELPCPMPLLSLKNLTFTYTKPTLLGNITLHIERGERIGLVGRNGAGKSTLMKLIAGVLRPDDGVIELQSEAVVARLEQEVPSGGDRTAFEVAADGFGTLGPAVADYRSLGHAMAAGHVLTAAEQKAYEQASTALANAESWSAADDLEELMLEMQLSPDVKFAALSAGMKRRVLLAAAMIRRPDVLLLDEPTNHLDIESIVWLQGFLKRFEGTLIFVTHDRMFLQELASRIIEVDRGRVFDWTCNYQTFLVRRDALLAAEAIEQAQFDKKLAEEEVWIRQGIKARRTRNEGRVRALKAMREERSQRRQKLGTAKLQLQEAERSGALVARLEDVSHAFGERTVIRNFSTTVFRGDKVGIIGPNGAGKSTLLRILLGDLLPTSGKVRLGTNISVGYFDQLRSQLDDTKTARENVSDGTDHLIINGQKKHVMGFLQDFLFSPDRAHTLAGFLSGGERNRLLLAKMMSKPSNVLVLDEPTNDLDAETLELLEDVLPAFGGTVFLVSHDRAFLNNVATSLIVFEGDGRLGEYDGGYDDWIRVRDQRLEAAQRQTEKPAGKSAAVSVSGGAASGSSAAVVPAAPAAAAPKRRLSFKEQRELEDLPERIAGLEQRQKELNVEMAAPGFFQSGGTRIAAVTTELAKVSDELLHCYERWELLEGGM
ncbi:MAG: ATP-binding cassette domain-containing protein [Planctomyces sp.]|jgi:ATP-binding cassette subfamily F protein uup